MNENLRHQQEYFREEVDHVKGRLKITFFFVHEMPIVFYVQ